MNRMKLISERFIFVCFLFVPLFVCLRSGRLCRFILIKCFQIANNKTQLDFYDYLIVYRILSLTISVSSFSTRFICFMILLTISSDSLKLMVDFSISFLYIHCVRDQRRFQFNNNFTIYFASDIIRNVNEM